MRAIDNVFRAVASAIAERVDLSHLAVTAWRKPEVVKLDAMIVRALGERGPETTVDDVVPNAIVGAVPVLAREHSRDKRQFIDVEDAQECINEYVELIRRASDATNDTFVYSARQKIRGAIRLSISAALNCRTLEESYRKGHLGNSLSFVTEVAEYYRDYKQQCHLMDTADVLAAELEPIEPCALCLLNFRKMPPLAMQALRRLLPKAHFCAVSA